MRGSILDSFLSNNIILTTNQMKQTVTLSLSEAAGAPQINKITSILQKQFRIRQQGLQLN